MDPAVRAALVVITRRLTDHGVPFALGGSGLLWAHRLTDHVGDLDLMVESEEEGALREAVADWVVAFTREGTDLWASEWFVELDVDGVDVDVIGGMAVRHAGGVARVPSDPATRVTVDDVTVPVADPAVWWVVYAAYKPDKARLLETIVDGEARERTQAAMGLAIAPGGDRPG